MNGALVRHPVGVGITQTDGLLTTVMTRGTMLEQSMI